MGQIFPLALPPALPLLSLCRNISRWDLDRVNGPGGLTPDVDFISNGPPRKNWKGPVLNLGRSRVARMSLTILSCDSEKLRLPNGLYDCHASNSRKSNSINENCHNSKRLSSNGVSSIRRWAGSLNCIVLILTRRSRRVRSPDPSRDQSPASHGTRVSFGRGDVQEFVSEG